MPIVKLQNRNGIETSYPVIPSFSEVLARHRHTPGSEVVHYPPNFNGEITPERWRELQPSVRYLLSVTETGESADFITENVAPYTNPLLKTQPRGGRVYDIDRPRIELSAAADKLAYMTVIYEEEHRCVIGGVMAYIRPEVFSDAVQGFPIIRPQ